MWQESCWFRASNRTCFFFCDYCININFCQWNSICVGVNHPKKWIRNSVKFLSRVFSGGSLLGGLAECLSWWDAPCMKPGHAEFGCLYSVGTRCVVLPRQTNARVRARMEFPDLSMVIRDVELVKMISYCICNESKRGMMFLWILVWRVIFFISCPFVLFWFLWISDD